MLPQKVILLRVMTLWAWSHEADTERPTDTFVPLLNQDWISSADAALWSSCRVRLCAACYIQSETRRSPRSVSAKSRTEQEFEWMAVRHLFQSDSALLMAPATTSACFDRHCSSTGQYRHLRSLRSSAADSHLLTTHFETLPPALLGTAFKNHLRCRAALRIKWITTVCKHAQEEVCNRCRWIHLNQELNTFDRRLTSGVWDTWIHRIIEQPE